MFSLTQSLTPASHIRRAARKRTKAIDVKIPRHPHHRHAGDRKPRDL